MPSTTYQIRKEKKEVQGMTDGLEAMKQAIFKILFTERYQYAIYDWSYGIELKDLIGKPKSFVIPELKKRIMEALLADDRIQDVKNFTFSSYKNSLTVKFLVETIYGNLEGTKEVEF